MIGVLAHLLLGAVFRPVSCQGCSNGFGQQVGCIAYPKNIAYDHSIDASNTCGDPPSGYCDASQEKGCMICDSRDPLMQHPSRMMVDKHNPLKPTWWQSQTMWDWIKNGLTTFPDPYEVRITSSFGKSYLITGGVRILFSNEPPKRMVIEKSTDFGKTWFPLQYFSSNCQETYGMQPDVEVKWTDPQPFRATCISKYLSPLIPNKLRYVSFDPIPRYQVNDYFNQSVRDYLLATDIRIRLVYPATDVGLFVNSESVLNRYYYAIADLQINGRCNCEGHAEFCDFVGGIEKCDCRHNTEGVNCERCLPLYNNQPWLSGNKTDANECQACECYNHADACTYSPTLGHGVCTGCRHNTAGSNCEKCLPGFYRNPTARLRDSNTCLPCECHSLGQLSGVCYPESDGITEAGQCICKPGVFGKNCDQCAPGKYGFTLGSGGSCQDCDCNLLGVANQSVLCDPYTGQCSCKASITGRRCDMCETNHYRFPLNIQQECLPCKCRLGGSTPCNPSTGRCNCLPGITGTTCDSIIPGYFIPSFSYLTTEFENFLDVSDLDIFPLNTVSVQFSGRGYHILTQDTPLRVSLQVEKETVYRIDLRYSMYPLSWWGFSKGSAWSYSWTNSNRNISEFLTSNSMSAVYLLLTVRSKLDKVLMSTQVSVLQLQVGFGRSYNMFPEILIQKDAGFALSIGLVADEDLSGSLLLLLDALVLSPVLAKVPVNVDPVTLSQGLLCTSYELPPFKEILSSCNQAIYMYSGTLYEGGTACRCSSSGSVNDICSPIGGQCPCKQGFQGRQCDQCLPGYYGDTSVGCQPCSCNLAGSQMPDCRPSTGQCWCRNKVQGYRCDSCVQGHFGLTSTNPDGCQACFAFGHATSCLEASRFQPQLLRTTFDENSGLLGWTIVDSQENDASSVLTIVQGGLKVDVTGELYLNAPQSFLGNKVLSYSQIFQLKVQSGGVLDWTTWHLKIHGFYSSLTAAFQFAVYDEGVFAVYLHESYSMDKSLDAFNLKLILANISQIQIRLSLFGIPSSFVLLQVGMTVATNLPSSDTTGIPVESAACQTGYTGSSCERCTKGFTRSPSGGGPHQLCVPCSCNGLASSCDPDTGECNGCRPGSSGLHCQLCLPTLLPPSCDRCQPGFWNFNTTSLSCKPCDCILNRTMGGNAAICDPLTGQCDCDPALGFGGRRCDTCRDNSVSSNNNRCTECPECYRLALPNLSSLRNRTKSVMEVLQQLSKLSPSSSSLSPTLEDELQQLRDQRDVILALTSQVTDAYRSITFRETNLIRNAGNISEMVKQASSASQYILQLQAVTFLRASTLSENITNFNTTMLDSHMTLTNVSRTLSVNVPLALREVRYYMDGLYGYQQSASRLVSNLTVTTSAITSSIGSSLLRAQQQRQYLAVIQQRLGSVAPALSSLAASLDTLGQGQVQQSTSIDQLLQNITVRVQSVKQADIGVISTSLDLQVLDNIRSQLSSLESRCIILKNGMADRVAQMLNISSMIDDASNYIFNFRYNPQTLGHQLSGYSSTFEGLKVSSMTAEKRSLQAQTLLQALYTSVSQLQTSLQSYEVLYLNLRSRVDSITSPSSSLSAYLMQISTRLGDYAAAVMTSQSTMNQQGQLLRLQQTVIDGLRDSINSWLLEVDQIKTWVVGGAIKEYMERRSRTALALADQRASRINDLFTKSTRLSSTATTLKSRVAETSLALKSTLSCIVLLPSMSFPALRKSVDLIVSFSQSLRHPAILAIRSTLEQLRATQVRILNEKLDEIQRYNQTLLSLSRLLQSLKAIACSCVPRSP